MSDETCECGHRYSDHRKGGLCELCIPPWDSSGAESECQRFSGPEARPRTKPVTAPTREEVLEGLRYLHRLLQALAHRQGTRINQPGILARAIAYLEAEISAGVPEITQLVTLRKEDCEPLLVPRDRVDELAEADWHPETVAAEVEFCAAAGRPEPGTAEEECDRLRFLLTQAVDFFQLGRPAPAAWLAAVGDLLAILRLPLASGGGKRGQR